MRSIRGWIRHGMTFCVVLLVGMACRLEAGMWRLTYADGTTQFSADLVSQPYDAVSEWVVSGTLVVTAGPASGAYSLYPLGPSPTVTDFGRFVGDDLLYTTSALVVDTWGVVWRGHGLELNFWSNDDGSYSFWTGDSQDYQSSFNGEASVTLTSIPEPATTWIAGAGVLWLLLKKFSRIRVCAAE